MIGPRWLRIVRWVVAGIAVASFVVQIVFNVVANYSIFWSLVCVLALVAVLWSVIGPLYWESPFHRRGTKIAWTVWSIIGTLVVGPLAFWGIVALAGVVTDVIAGH